jgi:hypothetical protein
LPRLLKRLKTILEKGLLETCAFWEPIRTGYTWVHRAAHLLNNQEGLDVLVVRHLYRQLLATMGRFCDRDNLLGRAAIQFRKVSKSYWSGLFACYVHAELPRTNNALEQQFGSYRHHERRSSGRKTASAMTVLRGSVRLVAALSTPARAYEGADLRPRCLSKWRSLRQNLQSRHSERAQQRRFRKDPQAYLENLEERLLKATLPM